MPNPWLVGVGALLGAATVGVIVYEFHPPPGSYIAVLGFMAVLITLLRPEMGSKEKALWLSSMLVQKIISLERSPRAIVYMFPLNICESSIPITNIARYLN